MKVLNGDQQHKKGQISIIKKNMIRCNNSLTKLGSKGKSKVEKNSKNLQAKYKKLKRQSQSQNNPNKI